MQCTDWKPISGILQKANSSVHQLGGGHIVRSLVQKAVLGNS